jgi:hypothetical protein
MTDTTAKQAILIFERLIGETGVHMSPILISGWGQPLEYTHNFRKEFRSS